MYASFPETGDNNSMIERRVELSLDISAKGFWANAELQKKIIDFGHNQKGIDSLKFREIEYMFNEVRDTVVFYFQGSQTEFNKALKNLHENDYFRQYRRNSTNVPFNPEYKKGIFVSMDEFILQGKKDPYGVSDKDRRTSLTGMVTHLALTAKNATGNYDKAFKKEFKKQNLRLDESGCLMQTRE